MDWVNSVGRWGGLHCSNGKPNLPGSPGSDCTDCRRMLNWRTWCHTHHGNAVAPTIYHSWVHPYATSLLLKQTNKQNPTAYGLPWIKPGHRQCLLLNRFNWETSLLLNLLHGTSSNRHNRKELHYYGCSFGWTMWKSEGVLEINSSNFLANQWGLGSSVRLNHWSRFSRHTGAQLGLPWVFLLPVWGPFYSPCCKDETFA